MFARALDVEDKGMTPEGIMQLVVVQVSSASAIEAMQTDIQPARIVLLIVGGKQARRYQT